GGVPRIAYHHRATKSLKLAELDAAGNVSLRTLIAPDPAFSNDVVGQSIALASDCGGRLHVVYQRRISTDAQPNLLLAYARITATGLEHKQFLPMTSSTAYQHYADAYGLDFYLAPDGKQYVAAQLNSIFGHGLYVATR
ncbi:MAG TPA: hypothetical protein VK427_23280, partial [Kofleriaceae bacterium]|nr:hypothetical protein [Kofleriaceae bacterium]